MLTHETRPLRAGSDGLATVSILRRETTASRIIRAEVTRYCQTCRRSLADPDAAEQHASRGHVVVVTTTTTAVFGPGAKRGLWTQDEVSRQIARLEDATRAALTRSPLPDHADVERVTAWAVDAQRRHWGW